MNTLILLSCLMQWGASKQEAQEEIRNIYSRQPSLQWSEINEEMLQYEKMYIKQEVKLKRL